MLNRRQLCTSLGWGAASAVLPPVGALAATAAASTTIGVCLPTRSGLRWVYDGMKITQALAAQGLNTDLQYGDDDVKQQVQQLSTMAEQPYPVLVVAAIDGLALGPALAMAKQRGKQIIAYDRLIRNTPHLDYYASFDNQRVGQLQGLEIEKRLALSSRSAAQGPATLELFAGSSDDNNAHVFFEGAMQVLQPHLARGTLQVVSGQTRFDQVQTKRWNGAVAKVRLGDLLKNHYTKRRLDALLVPNDGIAIDLIALLKVSGYGLGGQTMPVITGQDADLPSVRAIIKGEQSATIFKNTAELAQATAQMVGTLVAGKVPLTTDDSAYHNGVKVVPSRLLLPVTVDKDNWKSILVDSGYYKMRDIR